MESLGKTLKSLREAKGMTLTDVSKATKIRITILSALENEEWENLPQRIFVKGFVKAYAKAIDGDETLLLDLFESSCPIEDTKIACPTFEMEPMNTLVREKRSYKWVFVLVILILLAGGGYLIFQRFYETLTSAPNKTVKEETTVVVPVIPEKKPSPGTITNNPGRESRSPDTKEAAPSATGTAASTATTEGVSAKRPETAKPETASPVVSEAPKGKPEPPVKKTGENVAVKSPTAATEAQPEKASNDNLVITAKMETWIGLKIDGKTRKEILLKPGKTFSTKVDKFVELLIGNAGGIDITFNGKQVENIGKPGQVVRLRLPRGEAGED